MKLDKRNNLFIQPITFKNACIFTNRFHRYKWQTQGCLFCLQLNYKDEIIGVAIIGRPISPKLADGQTAELTRLTILEGFHNSGSWFLKQIWKAAKSLGYKKLVTYTGFDQKGTIYLSANFKLVNIFHSPTWHPERENLEETKTALIKADKIMQTFTKKFEISDGSNTKQPVLFNGFNYDETPEQSIQPQLFYK